MATDFDDWDDGETLDLQGTGFSTVDWTEDMGSPYALLNRINYGISIVHDLDGLYTGLETIPSLATEKAGLNLWVLMTSGFFHRIQLTADSTTMWGANNEPIGQQYHIRFLEATMYYQGQLA